MSKKVFCVRTWMLLLLFHSPILFPCKSAVFYNIIANTRKRDITILITVVFKTLCVKIFFGGARTPTVTVCCGWNETLSVILNKKKIYNCIVTFLLFQVFRWLVNLTSGSAWTEGPMHFWIDKHSQTCGFSGRHRVPTSLSSSGTLTQYFTVLRSILSSHIMHVTLFWICPWKLFLKKTFFYIV